MANPTERTPTWATWATTPRGNDLVLYYGDQSYFPGIIILGWLDGDAAQRISELDGPISARVEAHDD